MFDDERVDLSGDFGLEPGEIEDMIERSENMEKLFSEAMFHPDPDEPLDPEASAILRGMLNAPSNIVTGFNPKKRLIASMAEGKIRGILNTLFGGEAKITVTDSPHTGGLHKEINIITPPGKPLELDAGTAAELYKTIAEANARVSAYSQTDGSMDITVVLQYVNDLIDYGDEDDEEEN